MTNNSLFNRVLLTVVVLAALGGVCASASAKDGGNAYLMKRASQTFDAVRKHMATDDKVLLQEAVPVKVAINEAVELAKRFGGDDSPGFVNGVLSHFA